MFEKTGYLPAIAFSVAMISLTAPASADRITLLLGTHHIDASTPYKEKNPGVFYTWDDRRLDLSVGAYRNSYGRLSVAGVLSYPLKDWESGELSAFAGLAHYPDDGRRNGAHIGGNVIGLGGLQIRQGNILVQAIPMTEGAAKGLLTFGLTFDLGE